MSLESPGSGASSSQSRPVLLICPPVGPASAPAEIEAWIARLAVIRREYAGNASALESVTRAERIAALMLELAREDSAALAEPAGEPPPPAG